MIVHPPKKPSNNPFQMLIAPQTSNEPVISDEEKERLRGRRDEVREQLRRGEWEEKEIEIEVSEKTPELEVGGNAISLGDMMGGLMPKRTKQRRMKIRDARKILVEEEAEKLIDQDSVQEEAIRRAEQHGIIFLDEIDKIAGRGGGHGPDVSREGVQRDILPIVEGSTVNTKYGPVKTDFMLFIAAGAFHVAKISDLIPELQGRFPVLVNLKSLTREDFVNILVKPDNALTRQYAALLETDSAQGYRRGGLHGERDRRGHWRAPLARRVRGIAGGYFLQRRRRGNARRLPQYHARLCARAPEQLPPAHQKEKVYPVCQLTRD